MNVYRMIGNNVGTSEAMDLAERLSAWHDAMVSHERAAPRSGRRCDDECPHADAGGLWEAAVRTFGARANELHFLRSRGCAAVGGRVARSAR